MAAAKEPAPDRVSEPVPRSEQFVSGLYRAVALGDVVHLLFYVDHIPAPNLSHSREWIIRRRLVIPRRELRRMIRQLQSLDTIASLDAVEPNEISIAN